MGIYEGTVEDVFHAVEEYTDENPHFPTISDLVPRVQALVLARREQEIQAAAQAEARPLPELESGEVDWAKVRTADLPPGYDHSEDEHWQRGVVKLGEVFTAKGEGLEIGAFGEVMVDLSEKVLENQEVGFQGASRPSEGRGRCPQCGGFRWVRTGGYDRIGTRAGEEGSRVIRCPTCCPGGVYDHRAEVEAMASE